MDCFFFSRNLCFIRGICICKKVFNCFCKSLTFFTDCFPVKCSFYHPDSHISCRICCICSKNLTETGLLRFMACHCNDSSMVSSCSIKSVNRICKENLIQHFHTLYIAGFHAKYNERTASKLFRFNSQLLSITNAGIKSFALWEKGIFTGFYGFQCIKISLFSFIPKAEVGLSCLFDRNDQILAFCDFPE